MSARDYWTQIANEWPDGRDRLWRTYSDTLNIALCRRWLPDGGTRRLLKTDLFDEAAAEGLWPALVGLAHHVDAMDLSPAVGGAGTCAPLGALGHCDRRSTSSLSRPLV